jgi:hypothetical protein
LAMALAEDMVPMGLQDSQLANLRDVVLGGAAYSSSPFPLSGLSWLCVIWFGTVVWKKP